MVCRLQVPNQEFQWKSSQFGSLEAKKKKKKRSKYTMISLYSRLWAFQYKAATSSVREFLLSQKKKVKQKQK